MVTHFSAPLPSICQYEKHRDIWAKVWKLLPNTDNNLLSDISHIQQSVTAAVALHFFSQWHWTISTSPAWGTWFLPVWVPGYKSLWEKTEQNKTNNPKPTIFPPWLRFAASLSRWKVICDSRGSGGSHRMNLLSHAPLPCCSLSCTWELFKPESRGRGQGLHTQQCKSHWKKSTMWHYTVWFPFEASYCQASENKDSRETPLKLSKVVGFLTLKSASSWAERLTLPSLFVLVVLQVALGLTQCSSSLGRRSLPALWEGEANIKILLGGILEQSLPFFKNPVVRNL